MNDIKKIISSDLCTSCGLCTLNDLSVMKVEKGIYIPKFYNKLNDKLNQDILQEKLPILIEDPISNPTDFKRLNCERI